MSSYKQFLSSEIQNLKIEIPLLNFSTITTIEPKRPTRCCHDGCKKKLMLSDFPCKCGKIHCSTHRPAEVHNCTFDFKANHKVNLLQHMSTAITASKVDCI
jgi:hypothetical protein